MKFCGIARTVAEAIALTASHPINCSHGSTITSRPAK
jgi:hypothetical protein